MKKLLLIPIIVSLFVGKSWAIGPATLMMFSGSGVSCLGTWCDNFNGGSGALEDRTGWGKEYALDGTDSANYHTLSNNEVQRLGFSGYVYNLADFTPTDEDYSVQIDTKTVSDDIAYIMGPIVRGSLGSGNAMTGYSIRIEPATNNLLIRRYVDGSSYAPVDVTMTNLDWSTYHTVKLTVSGTGATVTLTAYVDGNQEATGGDTGATRIVTTGNGGVFSSWSANENHKYLDNFIITD